MAKRLSSLIALMFVLATVFAQPAPSVRFTFAKGTIAEGTLKTTIERNISALLTAINQGDTQLGVINLRGVNIEPAARDRLANLYNLVPFVCNGTDIHKRCLNDAQGYQVRGIYITMKPRDNTYKQAVNRELTISIHRTTGRITGVRFAMETQADVSTVLGSGKDVEDQQRRLEILKWVEDFRCYYEEKDIKSLNQIFDDKALIITGSVVKSVQNTDLGRQMKTSVKYRVQNKPEYIANLTRLFANTRSIEVKFDSIRVVRHGANDNFYGVTLHQDWGHLTKAGGKYSDEGWLFLLWDFRKPDEPVIHVRTWQSDEEVLNVGCFDLDDFKFSVSDH